MRLQGQGYGGDRGHGEWEVVWGGAVGVMICEDDGK